MLACGGTILRNKQVQSLVVLVYRHRHVLLPEKAHLLLHESLRLFPAWEILHHKLLLCLQLLETRDIFEIVEDIELLVVTFILPQQGVQEILFFYRGVIHHNEKKVRQLHNEVADEKFGCPPLTKALRVESLFEGQTAHRIV